MQRRIFKLGEWPLVLIAALIQARADILRGPGSNFRPEFTQPKHCEFTWAERNWIHTLQLLILENIMPDLRASVTAFDAGDRVLKKDIGRRRPSIHLAVNSSCQERRPADSLVSGP